MAKTDIEWTRGADGSPGATWNPLRGCRRISPGCEHCYAERQAARPILSGPGLPYEGLVQIGKQGPRWTGATAGPDRLDEPLRRKKPRMVFVCSMSDLFFEGHAFGYIAAIFGVMAATPHITYQVLTKRAERMAKWFEWVDRQIPCWSLLERNRMVEPQPNPEAACRSAAYSAINDGNNRKAQSLRYADRMPWPLPNVWIGVSVEDQQRAEERLPHLLRVPAAVRWVSAEPLLGPVHLGLMGTMPHDISTRYAPVCERIHWVVTGGESGPGARPCDLAWIRALRDECQQAQVPVFVKQMGARPFDSKHAEFPHAPMMLRSPKGGDMAEWPADLRVREWPEVSRG